MSLITRRGFLGLLAALCLSGIAQGAITRVGVVTASATTCTFTTHQAGDFLVVWAVRGGSTTAPTLPSGYVSILTKSNSTATTLAGRLGFKVATTTNDSSGTWTNASELVCAVYRPSSGNTILFGQFASSSSTTATVTFPALSPMGDSSSGNSWALGLVGASNTTQAIGTAPSGMTNEALVTGASYQAALHDTNAGVSSWSSTTANVTSTGSTISATIEMVLLPNTAPTNVYSYIGGGTNWSGKGAVASTTYKLPFPKVSGTGNTVVFGFTTTGGISVSSVSGSCNGSYGSPVVTATGGNLDSRMYVLPNITSCASPELITVTLGTAESVFSYFILELNGVTTSAFTATSGTTIQSRANSTTQNTGSMTPPNNNATGGNIVVSWHQKSDTTPTTTTTEIFAGANFVPLTLNNAYGFTDGNPYAVQLQVQGTSAALTPGIVSVADAADNWNSLAVAIKVASGSGTAPPAGIQVNDILHMTTGQFPGSGTYRMRVPFYGNARVVACTDPNLNTLTATDSEGNSWTAVSTSGIFYFGNASANPNLEVYITGGGGDSNVSWRTVDVSGAATSPFDVGALIADGSTGTTYTPSAKPSPTVANDLVIENVGLGQGPGTAVTAPAGAIWDLATYTGETDIDGIENADIMAHYKASSTGSITFTYTVANSTSSSGGYIALKQATGGTCTHNGYTNGGASALPNGTSGSYVGKSGSFVTPDCSTIQYWQPALGNFGTTSIWVPPSEREAANDGRYRKAAGMP